MGNVGAIRALAACRADLEAKTANGLTAVMLAAATGDADVARALLEQGASVQTRNKDGWNALFFAADERNDDVFKVLVAKRPARADFEAPRQSVLNLGCMEGSRLVVEAALACSADKEFSDFEGFTPLLCAVENGHLEIARMLLARGTNPKARTKAGAGALDLAAGTGNLELVQAVLEQGLGAGEDRALLLGGALKYAARKGHVDVVKYLLEKSANVECKNQGWQPIHGVASGPKALPEMGEHRRKAACVKPVGTEADYMTTAELLIAHGADVNAKTETGESPLSVALRYGFHRMADLLVAKGAALDGRSENGRTLLHMACAGGNKKVAELLLAKGAATEACDAEGLTPLHLAADYGRHELVELLVSLQAKLEAKTRLGNTALHMAAQGHQGYPDQPPPDADYAAVAETLIRHGADIRAVMAIRGAQPLHIAAVHGNAAVARVLLAHGAPLEERDNYGQTPLFIAIGGGRSDIVKLLLDRGANYKRRMAGGETALHVAAGGGNLELVQLFLSLGMNVDADSSEPGYTPLCYAALYGRMNVARYLIEKGAQVDPATSEPPLIKVAAGPAAVMAYRKALLSEPDAFQAGAEYEYQALARLLIAKGANIDVVSKYGDTPLLVALRFGFAEMADLLIEQGAELRTPSRARCTLLHAAAKGGNRKVAELLLSKGADVASLGEDGFTPLHIAADNGRPELIEVLLKHGAKLDTMVWDGRTALHLAAQGRQDDSDKTVLPPPDADYAAAAEVLIRHGATVHAGIGGSGLEQPLHTAAQYGNTAVAKVLLDHGAKVDAVDEDGNTPLTRAILFRKQAVAELLVARHANVNRVTKDGLTLLELAKGKGLVELAALLQKNAANVRMQTSFVRSEGKGPGEAPQAERKAESVEAAEKALAVAERNFGADAPGNVVYLCRVADAYADKGQLALAGTFCRRTGLLEKEASDLEKRAALILEVKR